MKNYMKQGLMYVLQPFFILCCNIRETTDELLFAKVWWFCVLPLHPLRGYSVRSVNLATAALPQIPPGSALRAHVYCLPFQSLSNTSFARQYQLTVLLWKLRSTLSRVAIGSSIFGEDEGRFKQSEIPVRRTVRAGYSIWSC